MNSMSASNLSDPASKLVTPAWVYLFSKFTSEALLFETLCILILVAVYAAFWVAKRRRFGAAGPTLPSGPIQTYLNELISNAEYLRMQLFGLLSASQAPRPVQPSPSFSNASPSSNPADQAQVAELTRALGAMTSEKNNLEKVVQDMKKAASELEAARAKSNGQNDEAIRLEQKIQSLEDKLSEYNIIEDDLANLKRFQQENTKLKAYLQEKGLSGPELSTPAGETKESRPNAAASSTQAASSSATPSTPASRPDVAHAPQVMPEEEHHLDETSAMTEFEGIAGKIGSSLTMPVHTEEPEPSAEPEPALTGPPSAAEARPSNPLESLGALAAAHEKAEQSGDPVQDKKSEEDLVKEFEKMLQD